MYDFELPEIRDFDLLNNLMENDAKDTQTTESDNRENLIVQMLKDKLDLDMNRDERFANLREIFFVRISFLDQNKNIINQNLYISKKEMEVYFDIKKQDDQEIKYKISIQDEIVKVFRKLLDVEDSEYYNKTIGSEISLKLDKIVQKERSSDSNSYRSTNYRSNKNDKKFIYYCRVFKDREHFIEVKHTKHEVDGNLKVKNKIDSLEKTLGEYLYYPANIKSMNKGEKILIEVKQNANFKIIFDQMKKLVIDFKILLPNEKYIYFGFVNEATSKKDLKRKRTY